jgi:hypothetical protein
VLATKAYAAPLDFTTAESIALSAPSTILVVATGSVADDLEVNAASVLIILSSSTGSTFTLMGPSYDLSMSAAFSLCEHHHNG